MFEHDEDAEAAEGEAEDVDGNLHKAVIHNIKLIISLGYFEKIKEVLTSKKITLTDIDKIDINQEKENYQNNSNNITDNKFDFFRRIAVELNE